MPSYPNCPPGQVIVCDHDTVPAGALDGVDFPQRGPCVVCCSDTVLTLDGRCPGCVAYGCHRVRAGHKPGCTYPATSCWCAIG